MSEDTLDQIEVAALAPEYNGCVIGESISPLEPNRLVYSLTDMVSYETMANRVPFTEARKKVAGIMRDALALHGAKCPVFVEERPIELQARPQPVPETVQLSEAEEKRIIAEIGSGSSKPQVLTPFPGTKIPDFNKKR